MVTKLVTNEAAKPQGRRVPGILIVDDDCVLRVVLADGIRRAGYRTSEAESGEQALELIARQQLQLDLVLIDVHLPGMSGIDLAYRLREDVRVPFLFLSGDSDTELVKLAADYGALGYMVKPLKFEQIGPGIESALRRAEELRQLHIRETQLDAALNQERETSIAVGLLMERLGVDRKTAFETLRSSARSQRCKIGDIARELLAAVEVINGREPKRRGGAHATQNPLIKTGTKT